METEINGKLYFDSQALRFLEHLNNNGFDIYWNKQWRPYEKIEEEILESDLLVAIVDSTWVSSTWMASELTWANGQAGVFSKNEKMKRIPIFIYPVDDSWKKCWLKSCPGPILLDREIEKAISSICNEMGWP